MLNETNIIRTLQAAFPGNGNVVGIGDDAAVLPLNENECYVVTKDLLVEHRHFRLSHGDAASLAHKALHVNLSDIAAMGAVPFYVMLGIALPPTLEQEWVDDFLEGFASACKKLNVELVGGDTTGSDRDLFISVTVIGRAEKTHLKFRNGAKPGDVICVAGPLGQAHAGFVALEHNAPGLNHVKKMFLSPRARVAEGAWLGAQKPVTAMMDVSDGLYLDLTRLLNASQCGGVIDLESMQASPTLQESSAALGLNARECMLTGGEDYALLMTVDAAAFETVAYQFQKHFSYRPMPIGIVQTGDRLELRENGTPVAFTFRPFSHFGEV